MAGAVYHDCSVLTWTGDDISGQSNAVEFRRTRPAIKWENFGDDVMNKDAGAQDNQIRVTSVYTETADEVAMSVLDAFEAAAGGTEGTLVCTPLSGGTTYTAVGKITDAPTVIRKGQVATLDFTVEVGAITRS